MIAKAEHTAAQIDLQGIAEQQERLLATELIGVTGRQNALKVGFRLLKQYHDQVDTAIVEGLQSVGVRSAVHYNAVLGLDYSEAELRDLVQTHLNRQLTEPYHGANLADRLYRGRVMSRARMTKAAHIGVEEETRKANIARHFVHKYPFGAQVNFDKRILLAQSVLLEHEIAKDLAEKADVKLAVWTLSKKHSVRDACDTLAEAVDKDVEAFMKKNNIDIDAAGVYFMQDVPHPPHPNCRCTLQFVHKKKVTSGSPFRSAIALQKLWKRIKPF